jgi:hypothetical protein
MRIYLIAIPILPFPNHHSGGRKSSRINVSLNPIPVSGFEVLTVTTSRTLRPVVSSQFTDGSEAYTATVIVVE